MPVLPTVPFYLAAAFCFAKSSKVLHDWFIRTKLYQKHLDSFVKRRAMTMAAKLRIMCIVTILMAIGFWGMKNMLPGRICLAAVWVWHLWYFSRRIQTIGQEETAAGGESTVERNRV